MLLEKINAPTDLQALSATELSVLAAEIRTLLIENVAQTGGHLAPNLGVVELTLALHQAFTTPTDQIIWDVGHQAYVHKILTGRQAEMPTLRQRHGLSGFPKRSESPHDSFGTGHASTSISAALGMAAARDMSGESHHIVAVIGDGSLTGGEAYEALNHAGHLQTKLIVVLNDNEMSIAKNVGAMAEYLAKQRTAAVRQPGMLFEDLGFTYIGPVDGHDLAALAVALQKAQKAAGPVVVHALTQKGRGYEPAEQRADMFHGIGPFCVESGKVHATGGHPSYTKVFGDTLLQLAEHDHAIAAITAAMPEGTGLKAFAGRFPERFYDVGIAEEHAVTMAAAMAAAGKKPVVALYSTFGQRAYDQIVHDVCLQELPVVLALDRAGLVGEDGPTHHGVFDYSYLRHIPNMIVMAPKDENELRHMLYTAIAANRPVAVRYPRGSGLGVATTEDLQPLPLGTAELIRLGHDVNFIAVGTMVQTCREAAALLQRQGVDAGVINGRFIKPLDEVMLSRLAVTGRKRIITVEENILAGGFGSAVLEYFQDNQFRDVELLRLGIPDVFVEQGSRKELLAAYQLDAAGIAARTLAFVRPQ